MNLFVQTTLATRSKYFGKGSGTDNVIIASRMSRHVSERPKRIDSGVLSQPNDVIKTLQSAFDSSYLSYSSSALKKR